MSYPPLPEWEQVRIPKKLPKWWTEIEAIPIESEAEITKKSANKYAAMPGMEAILCCLQEANKPLKFRHIVNALGKKETSVAGWLHRLQGNGVVTYEERDRVRYWRLLKPGEIRPSLDSKIHYGPIQRHLITVLKANPERWFSPKELQALLGISHINKVIQSLQSLVRTGEVEARREPDRPLIHPRRHPYCYHWPTTEKSLF